MSALALLSAPSAVAEALAASVGWATDLDLCTPSVDSRLGRWQPWRDVVGGGARVRRAFVGLDGLRSEPHALESLHRLGALRLVPAADGSFRAHAYRFRCGARVRVITGSGAFVPDGLMGPLEAVTVWEGSERDPYAVAADRLFATAARLAHVPEPDELRRYALAWFRASPHRDAVAEIGAPMMRRTAFDGELMELEPVTGGKAVRAAIAAARRQLRAAATMKCRKAIGHRGGSAIAIVFWSAPLGIWMHFGARNNRYWNCFGTERPDGTALQITVAINPPLVGVDRKIGGAVARDPRSGRLYLVHRGRIGGGQRGVGAELFWRCFRGGARLREDDRAEPTRVVIVGELGSPAFPRDLAAFVHEVGRIKRAAA